MEKQYPAILFTTINVLFQPLCVASQPTYVMYAAYAIHVRCYSCHAVSHRTASKTALAMTWFAKMLAAVLVVSSGPTVHGE